MPNFKTITIVSAELQSRIENIKQKYQELEDIIKTSESRELSLAITNLEQSCMWAIKNLVLKG